MKTKTLNLGHLCTYKKLYNVQITYLSIIKVTFKYKQRALGKTWSPYIVVKKKLTRETDGGSPNIAMMYDYFARVKIRNKSFREFYVLSNVWFTKFLYDKIYIGDCGIRDKPLEAFGVQKYSRGYVQAA